MLCAHEPDWEELRDDAAHVLSSIDCVDVLPRLVEFVQALCETPPVGQNTKHNREPVSSVALRLQVDCLAVYERLLLVVACDIK